MMTNKYMLIVLFILLPIFSQTKIETTNLTLEQFINYIAEKTDKTILYEDSVSSKKIYLVNLKAKSSDELLKIFYSVLEFNGYIVEKIGTDNSEIIKLKRSIQGPWTSTPMIFTKEELDKVANEDIFISMVIKLKHISVREVQTALRSLRIVNPQGGNFAGLEGSNSLLITDYAPNVKRVYSVIKEMDQKTENIEISKKIFPIENKTIPVTLNLGKTYGLSIDVSKNVFVSVKDENDNIIMTGSGSRTELWLNHHLENSASKKIQLELEVLKEDHSEIKVQVFDKDGKIKTIWNFTVFLPLPKNKKIKFTLAFAIKN